MNKVSYMLEKVNDGYVNLFKEWYFWRAYEYSALYVNKLTGYKLMLDVYKSENFVSIVCGFGDNLLEEVVKLLDKEQVKYRLVRNSSKWWDDNEIIVWKPIDINRDKLVKMKQKLMKV